MVEKAMQIKGGHFIYSNILNSLIKSCTLISKSALFGEREYKNGGIAIFHLYENYVPKYDNDENGLDKVSHFLFSTLISFTNGVIHGKVASFGAEIADWAKQKIWGIGTGFDKSDIAANDAGIAYGVQLRTRVANEVIKKIF